MEALIMLGIHTPTANPTPQAPSGNLHGAFPNKDGTTRFSLWAPDAQSVAIRLGDEAKEIHKEHELYPTGDGWYCVSLECEPGTTYSYIINNDLRVPDPAARAQVSDVHGASRVVDQAYPWKCVTWQGRPWHEAIIYELHIGLLGGFVKAEDYLPNLVELGVTAIELMPVNEFPGSRNWGYDGVLPFAPESSYGTPDELKSLIDTAHDLGLMVIIDVVYNHFGPDGNYLGQYAKKFFRSDIHTPWGDAIDFRQREVRDYFCENALMWVLDYRVDGLRLDAVHAISEKDFLIELAERVRSAVLPNRYVHLILENEDNDPSLLLQGYDAQWNDDGHNVLHHILTDEEQGYYANFADSPTAKLARCLNDGFVFQGEHTRGGKRRGQPSGHLPPTSFVLFLQNHDQIGNRAFGERLSLLADPEALRVAVALMLLCPMVPLLFMGEEWGSRRPFLFFTDHHDELADAVREGRRNEFTEFDAFQNPEMREKIPDPNDPSTFEHSTVPPEAHAAPEHQEWWDYYRKLIALRRAELIPRLPGTRAKGVQILGERAITALWQMGDGSRLRIYLNLSEVELKAVPSWQGKRLLFNEGINKDEFDQEVLPSMSLMAILEESA